LSLFGSSARFSKNRIVSAASYHFRLSLGKFLTVRNPGKPKQYGECPSLPLAILGQFARERQKGISLSKKRILMDTRLFLAWNARLPKSRKAPKIMRATRLLLTLAGALILGSFVSAGDVVQSVPSAPPTIVAPGTEPISPLPEGQSSTWAEGDSATRFWAELDFLIWSMRGATLPPLITTSPQGTTQDKAGVLGQNGTTTLFGGQTANGDFRVGNRYSGGYWFDDAHHCGVEADLFWLSSIVKNYGKSSNGDPILARPFFNPVSGQEDSQLIAFPGTLAGTVDASAHSNGLLGAGFLFRQQVCGCDCYHLNVLVGYRYLHFNDSIDVNENLTSLDPNNLFFVPVNTNIQVHDSFAARNDLHALDLGLDSYVSFGPLILGARAKVAVGYNEQVVDINGNTTITVPGTSPVVSQGGLYALHSNIGHYARHNASAVPELDLKLAYRVTPHLKASIGYTVMDWINVVRGAEQIDRTVNPNLLPPINNPVTGPNRPAFSFQQNNMLIDGLTLGLEYDF
jgi:hypothetical protein